MAWLRIDDSALTHPKLFELLEACDGDHALRNEAWGFLVLASSVSAQHLTDYVVSTGLLATIAPGRHQYMIDLLTHAGLMEPVECDGRKQHMIVTDEQLLHMRKKAEVEIDRARKRDSRNPEVTIAARIRDGDVCRWCGKTVSFSDRRSARGGTIDSLNGHEDSTVDTVVVACRGCNSIRKEQNKSTSDWQPLPVPSREEVYYEDSTIEHINGNSWAQSQGIKLTPKQTEISFDDPTPERKKPQPRQEVKTQPQRASSPPEPRSSALHSSPLDCVPPVAEPSTRPGADAVDDAARLRREFREEQRRREEVRQQQQQAPNIGRSDGGAPAPVPDDQAPAWLYASSEELFGNKTAHNQRESIPITQQSQDKKQPRSGIITKRSHQNNRTIFSGPFSVRGSEPEGDVQEKSGTGRDGSGLVGTGRNGTGRSGPGRLWSGLAGSLRSLKGSGRKD